MKRWLGPFDISEDCWFYENHGSIDLIQRVRDSNGNVIKTQSVRLKFSKLAQSGCMKEWFAAKRRTAK